MMSACRQGLPGSDFDLFNPDYCTNVQKKLRQGTMSLPTLMLLAGVANTAVR